MQTILGFNRQRKKQMYLVVHITGSMINIDLRRGTHFFHRTVINRKLLMKKSLTVIAASLLVLCLNATAVLAGGYQLNLLGQRQIAMGHTGVGMPLDIATISLLIQAVLPLSTTMRSFWVPTPRSSVPITVPRRHPAMSAKTDSPMRTPFSIYASYVTPVENLRAGNRRSTLPMVMP
jgi:hypothetical protein